MVKAIYAQALLFGGTEFKQVCRGEYRQFSRRCRADGKAYGGRRPKRPATNAQEWRGDVDDVREW